MSNSEDDQEVDEPHVMTRPVISVTITPRPLTTSSSQRRSTRTPFGSRPRTGSVNEAKMASAMAKSRNGQQQIMELFKMKNRTPMPAICKDPVPICGQKLNLKQQPGNNCSSPVPSVAKSGYRSGARHLSLDIDLRNSQAHCHYYRIDEQNKQKVLVIKDSEILEDPMPEYQLPRGRKQLSDPFVRKRVHPQTIKGPDLQFNSGMRHIREKLKTSVSFPEKSIPTRQAWAETAEKEVTLSNGKHKIIVYYNKKGPSDRPKPSNTGNTKRRLGQDISLKTESEAQSSSARPVDGCLYTCLKDSIYSLKHGKHGCGRTSSGTRRRQSTPALSASLRQHSQRGSKRVKSASNVSPERE
ncbi:uncharacterized protein [Ptychodera flava]|uniref:uncharacterized protein n=1 Tax=Ptychodera flava TaxID=63121 RepID=UPI00396A065C